MHDKREKKREIKHAKAEVNKDMACDVLEFRQHGGAQLPAKQDRYEAPRTLSSPRRPLLAPSHGRRACTASTVAIYISCCLLTRGTNSEKRVSSIVHALPQISKLQR